MGSKIDAAARRGNRAAGVVPIWIAPTGIAFAIFPGVRGHGSDCHFPAGDPLCPA